MDLKWQTEYFTNSNPKLPPHPAACREVGSPF